MTDNEQPDAREEMIFDPMRGDPILSTMRRFLHPNPLLLGAMYLAISLGGVFLLSWLGGVLKPVAGVPRKQFMSLLHDYGNLLNFALIIPLGIVLVFRFYHRLQQGFYKLIDEGILQFKDGQERDAFLWTLDHKINRSWYFWLSMGISIALNLWISFHLKGSWNSFFASHGPAGSLHALPAAVWFRFFTTINFALVFFVLIRGVAVLRLMRLLFEQELHLQPLHPDKCSGLLPLGRISGSLNLFIALITLYLTVLIVVDGIPLTNPMFLTVVVVFFAFSTFLFLRPLLYSHKHMQAQKDRILHVINRESQGHFIQLGKSEAGDGTLSLELMQRMEVLERLSQAAQRMPTWPMNLQTFGRFFAVGGGPVIVALLKFFLMSPQPTKGKKSGIKLPPAIQKLLPSKRAKAPINRPNTTRTNKAAKVQARTRQPSSRPAAPSPSR